MKTSWRRDIRCISATDAAGATGSGAWEWKDEHGKWNSYAADVCRLLDACRLCGVDEWMITACGRTYRVEVGAGTQGWGQVNVDTGVRREVRCGGGSGDVTGDAAGGASVGGASAATTSSSSNGKMSMHQILKFSLAFIHQIQL